MQREKSYSRDTCLSGMSYGMNRDAKVALFAANLKAAMERKGTNAAEVARKGDLNPTAVYDFLKGKSVNPRLDTLVKMSKGVGVPLSSLFLESGASSLDLEIFEALASMPDRDRERFLALARSFSETAASA